MSDQNQANLGGEAQVAVDNPSNKELLAWIAQQSEDPGRGDMQDPFGGNDPIDPIMLLIRKNFKLIKEAERYRQEFNSFHQDKRRQIEETKAQIQALENEVSSLK